MPPNAADRKSIRRLEKAAKLADEQRRQVISNLMSTFIGREWMWNILSSCGVFSTTFIMGAPDASAFNEGRRSVGLQLITDIMASCPDQYIQAQRESNERSSLDERRSSAESDGGDSGSVPDDSAAGYFDDDLDRGSLNDRSAAGNG
jgi:hypothetical protein